MSQTQDAFRPTHYLAPKFWPVWLGIGIVKTIPLLPYRVMLRLGRAMGNLMYRLMPRRRRIGAVNLKLCFPELSQAERKELLKRNFQSVATAGLETALAWWAPDKKLRPLAHYHGIQHFKDAIASGKSVILLTAHFTCLEIGARMLLMEQQYAGMYKRHRNELLEAVISRSRSRHCKIAIQQDDIRGFLRLLKNKVPVWYAPDQDLGLNRSVFAPFMGIPTATITAASRFAKMTDAVVVPYFPTRRDDGNGYDIEILPPLKNFPTGDDVTDATTINRLIEEHARKTPAQYLWLHRRFKTRPPGEPSVYEQT
ncbi:MAG: LpxL/LpxP family Kdo(2)-lipid IV(A) lauroyl/palmitoleoyl acyltransferase [Gammaproteobacteria bacterium]|nr:LpxL/LpxP family Kdo(2)-lipid IV(A) lauroyl/palmitoleoyl acyltransferase [Gammaproteobacteria bacterium]